MADLTEFNNIVCSDKHEPAVGKDEIERGMMKQCQEQSSSESQDWNSHAVCDNGVVDGMRLCAVQKVDPPDDVGLEWAMTLGELMDGWPLRIGGGHSGESYQIIVTRWGHFDVSQHVIRCSLSEE
jgi:hypothetical protein